MQNSLLLRLPRNHFGAQGYTLTIFTQAGFAPAEFTEKLAPELEQVIIELEDTFEYSNFDADDLIGGLEEKIPTKHTRKKIR